MYKNPTGTAGRWHWSPVYLKRGRYLTFHTDSSLKVQILCLWGQGEVNVPAHIPARPLTYLAPVQTSPPPTKMCPALDYRAAKVEQRLQSVYAIHVLQVLINKIYSFHYILSQKFGHLCARTLKYLLNMQTSKASFKKWISTRKKKTKKSLKSSLVTIAKLWKLCSQLLFSFSLRDLGSTCIFYPAGAVGKCLTAKQEVDRLIALKSHTQFLCLSINICTLKSH